MVLPEPRLILLTWELIQSHPGPCLPEIQSSCFKNIAYDVTFASSSAQVSLFADDVNDDSECAVGWCDSDSSIDVALGEVQDSEAVVLPEEPAFVALVPL